MPLAPTVDAESLPRLGEEISAVEDEGVDAAPIPHAGDSKRKTPGSRALAASRARRRPEPRG
jgi:hypothetical protein